MINTFGVMNSLQRLKMKLDADTIPELVMAKRWKLANKTRGNTESGSTHTALWKVTVRWYPAVPDCIAKSTLQHKSMAFMCIWGT